MKRAAEEEKKAPPHNTLSEREVAKLGLCRRSILDPAWHEKFPEASRSLLNFESLKEFLVYASILFPALRDDINFLRKKGVDHFVRRINLRPLEQCILCRVLPKMGITDMQVGFIWGRTASAVSRIKTKWFPLWGYAGRLLTDLELYEDYANLEPPDAYYDNQLGDMGCQCDGKDFYTKSV